MSCSGKKGIISCRKTRTFLHYLRKVFLVHQSYSPDRPCLVSALKVYFTAEIGDASPVRVKVYRNTFFHNEKIHHYVFIPPAVVLLQYVLSSKTETTWMKILAGCV